VGPTLGLTKLILQGLFLAPSVVAGALKGAVYAAHVFERMGYDVMPRYDEERSDIVQAICLRSEEAVLAFCNAVQRFSPVDGFAAAEPSAMPGYDVPVIMAAGAFNQGSSIELSADAPMKAPWNVFLQGGLCYAHTKLAVGECVCAVQSLFAVQ
jgi:cystathionine beta-lyase family protein involved in aluminum resistance